MASQRLSRKPARASYTSRFVAFFAAPAITGRQEIADGLTGASGSCSTSKRPRAQTPLRHHGRRRRRPPRGVAPQFPVRSSRHFRQRVAHFVQHHQHCPNHQRQRGTRSTSVARGPPATTKPPLQGVQRSPPVLASHPTVVNLNMKSLNCR
jgi:hypothetical protein